jgi:hypothetical protein
VTSAREPAPGDLAADLGNAIDELAAGMVTDESAGSQIAQRLARAWAMITAADPEMASRTARY